jgi:hypothetical protein
MEDFHSQMQPPMQPEMQSKKIGLTLAPGERKSVYTIVDRPGNQKGFWVRIGSAWVNNDLSLNVILDALPVNHKMHIRDADPERPRNRGPLDPGSVS